jgi:polysaccharide biosynthesis protein PslH
VRVLFLTHRLPYAPNRGDRIRAYHIIRTLAQRTSLEVVSLAHDERELAEIDSVRRLGARVTAVRTAPARGYLNAGVNLATNRPLTHALLDAPQLHGILEDVVHERPPDVVLAYCSGMARFAFEPPLDRFPTVIDFVDIDSEKWSALAGTSSAPRRWLYAHEARTLGVFEADAAERAAASLVVTDREREALLRIAPGANVHVVYNGVAIGDLQPTSPPVDSPRVVFCGVMNYTPNVDGVLWFAHHVWPLIHAARPDATFTIVGASPTAAITRLATSESGIEVTGTVPDVREYLWGAAVSVAPLLTARGTQNKVLEALAAGLPTVVTPQVAGGLPIPVRSGCTIAESAADQAKSITLLLALPGEARRAIAARVPLRGLDWDSQLEPIFQLLDDAVKRRGNREQPPECRSTRHATLNAGVQN